MNQIIPFIDLSAQYKNISKEIDSAINRVISKGDFTQGEEITNFENKFSKFVDAKYCVSLNSGTDALILGLRGMDLKQGDEIIVPAFTFIATAIAPIENNLKPVFVDIDESDFEIDLNDLKRKINSKTRAIICVHLYGLPDKINEIKEIIKKSGQKIHLIEDACQAHGATYKGKHVGTFGIFSAFSFYPTKNIGAYGDGGALITNNDLLGKKIRQLKQYGETKRYYSEGPGINSRLDAIQAAILSVKLKYLNIWNKKRQNIAKYYSELFIKKVPQIVTPKLFADRNHVFHIYAIRSKKRDQLQKYLLQNGISSLIHYPKALHLQKVYKKLGYKSSDFPNAEKVASEVLSIPLYPEMPIEFAERVVKSIESFYSS